MIIISKHATVLTESPDDDSEIREGLAKVQHEIWAHWMKYLLSRMTWDEDVGYIVSPVDVMRWKRQMRTAYGDLADYEKDSDRSQADKVLALLYGQAG